MGDFGSVFVPCPVSGFWFCVSGIHREINCLRYRRISRLVFAFFTAFFDIGSGFSIVSHLDDCDHVHG